MLAFFKVLLVNKTRFPTFVFNKSYEKCKELASVTVALLSSIVFSLL